MVDLSDTPVVTPSDLVKWYETRQQIAVLNAAESELRARIFKHYFKTPEEGVNSQALNDGTGAVLKGTHVINRTVDQASLDALRKELADAESKLPEIPVDELIRWKPELKVGEYRKLSPKQRKAFDRVLVIKPGMPQLEITIPKR
jgi:hypothetical protein